MAKQDKQLKSLRADLDKARATAKKLPEFRAEVGNLEHRLDTLRAVLPEEKDAADLLRRLQTVAMQSNLVIIGFKPAPVVTKQVHAEWPITLELEGNYHNLAAFFDRLGKFTRIVNISALEVKGKENKRATRRHDCVRNAWRRRSCCSTRRRSKPPKKRRKPRPENPRRSLRLPRRRWPDMRVLFTAVGIIAFSGTLFAQAKAPAKSTPKAALKPVADVGRAPTSATDGGSRRVFVQTGRTARSVPGADRRRRNGDPHAGDKHADGPSAFMVGEISVRGVMQSRSSLVAMIKGPDNKTYLIHQGDKLADGVVKTVTPQGLVVLQDISDPLSAQKQREVRKLLRSLEDAKEKL